MEDELKKIRESQNELEDFVGKLIDIVAEIPSGKDGKDGKNGKDGRDGKDGLNGIDGEDGSPDTPKDIVAKLNTQTKALNWSVLKDFDSIVNQDTLKKAIQTLENQTRYLIQANTQQSSTDLQTVAHDLTLTGDGTVSSPLSVVGGDVDAAWALEVRLATTAALSGTYTYDNGTAGVGATLTRTTNGALGAIDGVTTAAGDRILVKNQATTLRNGVYEITQLGSASTPVILTRTTDADETSELDDMIVIASAGSTNRGIPYGQQTNNPTIGTDAITFAATGIYLRQQTSGTQAINQIPVYTSTAQTLTRGTAAFTYSPSTGTFLVKTLTNTNLFSVASSNKTIQFGDLTNAGNKTKFFLTDGPSSAINATIGSTGTFQVYDADDFVHLAINLNTNVYTFGDVDGSNNSTYVSVNDASQVITFSKPILVLSYTVATLPAGTSGMRAHVTDASGPVFGSTVVGGGAVTVPVFYNGANWIVG